MNAFLIDDEPKATKLLYSLLVEFCPDINIIGTASNAKEAYPLLLNQRPELVFLDVAMPEESGFDLLRRLPSIDFEIIFVTGFDDYAIDAIKFCAIGYIVKPIRESDLIRAVNQAAKRIQQKAAFDRYHQLIHNLTHPGQQDNRVGIPTTTGIEFIPTKDIIRCEGMKGCTKVVIRNRKNIISSYNMGEFKKLLEEYGFYLPHKSHLVNLTHIQRYDREGSIVMTDGVKVPVSRRKRQGFLDVLTGRNGLFVL